MLSKCLFGITVAIGTFVSLSVLVFFIIGSAMLGAHIFGFAYGPIIGVFAAISVIAGILAAVGNV